MIHQATKGWGANAKKVIDAIATKDADERLKLSRRYKELYDTPLHELVKKEFKGDFKLGMTCLAMPLDEAECYMIKKATDGVGAHIAVVYSILCGRTNVEINKIKKNYFRLYTKDLGKLMSSELHGDMER
jgi:Annexin